MSDIKTSQFIVEVNNCIQEYLSENNLFKPHTKLLRITTQTAIENFLNSIIHDRMHSFSKFSVICDESNNPIESVDTNEFNVDVIFTHRFNDATITLRNTLKPKFG